MKVNFPFEFIDSFAFNILHTHKNTNNKNEMYLCIFYVKIISLVIVDIVFFLKKEIKIQEKSIENPK